MGGRWIHSRFKVSGGNVTGGTVKTLYLYLKYVDRTQSAGNTWF